MGRGGAAAVAIMLALGYSADARAQPNCGSVQLSHDLRAHHSHPAVELLVRTSREIVACPLEVQAEGWVNGVGGASTNRGTHSAEVYVTVPVGINGSYTSTGKHWLIWNIVGPWEFMGTTFGGPAVVNNGMCVPPIPEWVCSDGGGTVSPNGCHCVYDTPIIVDVAGDGYRLTSAAEGVNFDLNADGIPEQIAWTEPDSDDAFLVMDRNGNGRIDNGSELFGNFTPAYADEAVPTASNGFEALKFLEGASYGGGRADGIINSQDAAFARLLLWRDANHNGISEPEELTPLPQNGLVALGTSYRESKRRDRHGNLFRLRGQSWWTTTTGAVVMRPVYDISLMRASATTQTID